MKPCRALVQHLLSLSVLLVTAFSTSAQAPAASPAADPKPAEEIPRGLRSRAEGAFEGYTLFSPLLSPTTYLVDMAGEVVHRWESGAAPGGTVYLLDNGHLLRGLRLEDNKVFYGGGIAGRLEELDWDGNVVWTYTLSSEDLMFHHDIEPMPNGNVLLIVWEFRYREDAIAYGRAPDKVSDKGFWPDAVYEIEPVRPEGGKIVWEWHVWDHLIQDLDPEKENYGSISEHPELLDINADHRGEPAPSPEDLEKQAELEEQMKALGYAGGDAEDEEETSQDGNPALPPNPGSGPDWLHTNAVDYQPQLDLIALSSPNLSEVWIIDHSTTTEQAASHRGGRYGKGGDMLWRWGNPKNYGAGTAADQALFFQHDVRWIPAGEPGAGHLTVFNNGQSRTGGKEYSSVEELVPPFDLAKGFVREGATFGPAKPVWEYSDPGTFYSAFISGAHRVPNGNTLICAGTDGRVFEVTPEGKVVWDYWNPFGGEVEANFGKAAGKNNAPTGVPPKALFRATRIAKDHPGLRGREL